MVTNEGRLSEFVWNRFNNDIGNDRPEGIFKYLRPYH